MKHILLAALCGLITTAAQAADKPDILVIWGDGVGMWSISAYHRGMMGGSTPNIDRIANEGMNFMDCDEFQGIPPKPEDHVVAGGQRE